MNIKATTNPTSGRANVTYYEIDMVNRFNDEALPAKLTVERYADEWEGLLFVRPDLYKRMAQVAMPLNRGFEWQTHEEFLDRVRMVFGFTGGVFFDFINDDYEPVSPK
ncbi:hypothetical protein G3A39_40805 [Paraburkholderia aspalathi]|nr:hypothetical protein [Paraburkholderia aspalathi]